MRLIVLLLGSTLFALPSSADACSCGGWTDLPTELRTARDGAGVIVHGRVVSVASGQVRIEVIEAFKGATGGAKLVVDPDGGGGGDCSYSFESGEEYLVYAHLHEGRVATSMCTRTRMVSKGDAELDWLRTGRLPPVPVALWREQDQCTPKEPLTAARCEWITADRAMCILGKELQPLAPETATPWVLACKPQDGFERVYMCQVVPGDAIR
ncbi:hypothetical protein [Pyxidicoccus caerfyrddinensis]|jgi:hypothetical protein|uniref:hypothetical protein n=1 Tax=Pyxidicoccus caerfyrddinensis TaxID=2709663 RepID=UPI0013DD06AA|nr:hypothetical protein [Pyxidicoccus caerfyrddinensis]